MAAKLMFAVSASLFFSVFRTFALLRNLTSKIVLFSMLWALMPWQLLCFDHDHQIKHISTVLDEAHDDFQVHGLNLWFTALSNEGSTVIQSLPLKFSTFVSILFTTIPNSPAGNADGRSPPLK